MHHGNFYSGESDERQRMWAGRRGDRNDMVTMAKGSKFMAHKSSDIARMSCKKYKDTCKKKEIKKITYSISQMAKIKAQFTSK